MVGYNIDSSEGKRRAIDDTGKLVIDPQLQNAAYFYKGLVVVDLGAELGFISMHMAPAFGMREIKLFGEDYFLKTR